MSGYKYFVTFNSKGEKTYPGVTVFEDEKTPLHKLRGLDYPHEGNRAAGVYTKDDKYVIRAVTSMGNLFEIDPFCHNGAEKYLKDTWRDCESVGTYRDCTVLVNKHVFLVNPEDIQLELHAGGDWHRNAGCAVHDGKVYVVSSNGGVWEITLQGWSVVCKVKQVKIGTVLSDPKFIAVDPRNGNLYIGDKFLKKWDGEKLHNHVAIDTSNAVAGGITISGEHPYLWYANEDNSVMKLDLDSSGHAEDTDLKSNGLGFV